MTEAEGGGVSSILEGLGPVQIVADRLTVLYPDELSLRRLLMVAKVDLGRE